MQIVKITSKISFSHKNETFGVLQAIVHEKESNFHDLPHDVNADISAAILVNRAVIAEMQTCELLSLRVSLNQNKCQILSSWESPQEYKPDPGLVHLISISDMAIQLNMNESDISPKKVVFECESCKQVTQKSQH